MGEERRRAVRSREVPGSRGRLRSTVEVDIVDLSSGGIRLELAAALRPGALYDLQADLAEYHLSAKIRVTRCSAGGFKEDGKGGRFILYRAGAEFAWESDEPRKALEAYLESRGRPDGESHFGFARLRE
jgi:hypothetical protein